MAEALEQAPEFMRKTKRELREEELISLMPQLKCDPAVFSDTELDGLIAMALRHSESNTPQRRRRR